MASIFAFFTISLALFLSGCATSNITPAKNNPSPEVTGQPSRAEPISRGKTKDFERMQKQLGLTRDFHELGYSEQSFDACENDDDQSGICRRQYMVVIHFQLLCRDSEGTVSKVITRSDMRPISDRRVNWNLKGDAGDVQTDSSGFGQIRTIASVSPRTQRLKLAVGSETLYLRAGEITRVVTPKPWCNPE